MNISFKSDESFGVYEGVINILHSGDKLRIIYYLGKDKTTEDEFTVKDLNFTVKILTKIEDYTEAMASFKKREE